MPNKMKQKSKTIELSPIENGKELAGNYPETIKGYSQTKKVQGQEAAKLSQEAAVAKRVDAAVRVAEGMGRNRDWL